MKPGSTLLGSYRVLEEIGGGGMAKVYKVCNEALEDVRAIKVLRPEMADDPRIAKLFIREAQVLTRVNHPAVVRCYDFLRDDPTGSWCLIMDLIEGEPLSGILRRGPLSIKHCWDLFKRVAEGLAAAHGEGVVHRDISPDNVILPDGRPDLAKLIDFGIVKLQNSPLTTVIGSDFAGKFAYAAPEQFGLFNGEVDARSDYFSLGLVLAEAATGTAVPMGTTALEAIRLREVMPKLPNELPAELRPAIEKLVQLDPAQRPQNSVELFALCRRDTAVTAIGSGKHRKPMIAPLAFAVMLIAAGGGSWWVMLNPDEENSGAGPQNGHDTQQAKAVPQAGAPQNSLASIKSGPAVISDRQAPRSLKREARAKLAKPGEEQNEVARLLGRAKIQMRARKLTVPTGDNAYDTYQKVLALDPDNVAAAEGLEEIAASYANLARQSVDRGELEKAVVYVQRGLGAAPDQSELLSLKDEITRRLAMNPAEPPEKSIAQKSSADSKAAWKNVEIIEQGFERMSTK